MGTFEDAHPITITSTALHRAVKARLGEREGNYIDLWVEVPVRLVAYEPPVDNTSQVTHMSQGQPQSRVCLSWNGPTYHGESFSSWCEDYIGTVNGFWDNRLLLIHSADLAAAAGTSHEYPSVRCRFYAHQEPQGFAMKHILVTAVAANNQPTSSCAVLGVGGYSGGIAAGYDSLLDSNDINERPRIALNGEQTRQIAACHEMGHYIGLQHRCSDTVQRVGWTPHDSSAHGGQYSDPQFGDRNGGGDDYCSTAQDGSLTHDVMASGMLIHRWHSYVWKTIWESIGTTPQGVVVPSTGWVSRVSREQ